MKKGTTRKGFVFKTYEAENQSPFEMLFEIFKELITHTSGDFDEAIDWLRELDKEYKLTTSEYTVDDFIEDLKKKEFYEKPTTARKRKKAMAKSRYQKKLENEQLPKKMY